jgi:CxxC-x17-CxxC domain-containing protein
MRIYRDRNDNDRGDSRNSGGRDRNYGGGGRSSNNRGSDRPQMFDAVCDECGKDCQVPFRPTSGKPVYCSRCFEKQEGGSDRGRSRDFGGSRGSRDYGNSRDSRSYEKKEMFSAICDECGKECEVPFKPSSDKPIYCSKCFETKGGNSRNDRSSGGNVNNEMLEAINTKLDRILELLEPKKAKAKKAKVKKEVAVEEIVADELETKVVEDTVVDEVVE